MSRSLLVLLLLLDGSAGQDRVELHGVPARATVGEEFPLELHLVGGPFADPQALAESWEGMKGLSLRRSGPLRRRIGVDGAAVLVIPFAARAVEAGSWEIPPLWVRREETGTVLASAPVWIEVLPEAAVGTVADHEAAGAPAVGPLAPSPDRAAPSGTGWLKGVALLALVLGLGIVWRRLQRRPPAAMTIPEPLLAAVREADGTGTAWRAFVVALAWRLDCPAAALHGADLVKLLGEAGWPAGMAREAGELQRRGERQEFSRAAAADPALGADAEAFLRRLNRAAGVPGRR